MRYLLVFCSQKKKKKRIGDVMVNIIASNAVDHGLESWSGQIKYYKMERVSGCCLTPTQQFFSYIMARTS